MLIAVAGFGVPTGDSYRHASTALLSSSKDCGENTAKVSEWVSESERVSDGVSEWVSEGKWMTEVEWVSEGEWVIEGEG